MSAPTELEEVTCQQTFHPETSVSSIGVTSSGSPQTLLLVQEEDTPPEVAVSFWRATWGRLQKDYAYAQILWDGLKDMHEYGELSWNPEITSMRLVRWWQSYVTGPDCMMPNRCPRGHGEHCSLKGLIALTAYGLPGWLLVANEMRKCRRDFDPGGCC